MEREDEVYLCSLVPSPHQAGHTRQIKVEKRPYDGYSCLWRLVRSDGQHTLLCLSFRRHIWGLPLHLLQQQFLEVDLTKTLPIEGISSS